MTTKSDTQQRFTPEWIDSLKENEIFVFGCRRSGRHWEGAAKFALEHFGAIFGQSEGLQGQAYSIPTAGVDLMEIKASVERFTQFASEHPELNFFVTPIGCGMGLWHPTHIAPLFKKASELNNVWLPEEFWVVINEPGKFSKLNFLFPKYSRR